MPVKKKDLYLAKSMSALNELAALPSKMTNNPKILLKSSEKIHKEAELNESLGDEEKAYIMYMKYFNVVMVIKKSPEYKKQKDYYDSLMGQKNLLKAIDKAEELSEKLKERYELAEAQEVANKLSPLDPKKVEKKEEEIEDLEIENKKEKETQPEEKKDPSPQTVGSISPTQLYDLMNDRDVQIVIMDVRTSEQYQESHIKHDSCITVPAETVPPGTTVTYIEKSLSDDAKVLWRKRGQVDHIVLMDWNSTFEKVKIGMPLRTLKDALFKYDSTVIVKSEPLVLEGGYEQWLLYYPQLTTNANVSTSSQGKQLSSAPTLDFDYPDFDADFSPTPKPKPVPDQTKLDQSTVTNQSNFSGTVNGPITDSLTKPLIPQIDRSTKPKPGSNLVSQSNNVENVDQPGVSSLYPSSSLSKSDKFAINFQASNSKFGTGSTKSDVSSTEIKKETKMQEDIKAGELLRKQKEAELARIQALKEQETQAQEQKLQELQKKIQDLEKMKMEQAKDVADLMRKKKVLNEEFQSEQKEEADRQNKIADEEKRKQELQRLQAEEEKRKRQEEVEKLRQDRKKKEEDDIKNKLEKEKLEKEALERAKEAARLEEERKKEEIRKAEEKANRLREEEAKLKEAEEETKRLQQEQARLQEKLQKEREAQQKLQEDQQRLKWEEAKLEEQRKLDQLRKEKEEKDRIEREMKEKQEKEKAEQARKEAEEKLRRLNLAETQPSRPQTIPSPNLPVGWEKRLDPHTRRYYYINHNKGETQWEPPSTPLGQYKMKLKDESSTPSRGLTRSNSSPNIAKMLADEDQTPKRPSVDRSMKPQQRVEVPQPKPQRKAIQRNLNPVYGSVGRALTGLRNLGNTCYMNSTIQCLNSTSPLATYFLTDSYLYDINRESVLGCYGEVADDFSVIIRALWSGQYKCITPRDFKYIVGKHYEAFSGTDQQDSQEFLTFLMDGLHEGLNKVKIRPKIPEQQNDDLPDKEAADIAWKHHRLLHESIIVELFQGQLKSTVLCLSCRKMSITFQAFMYLSLPIPSSSRCSLGDCLKQFLKEEKLTGSSRWRCPQCKVDRDAVKKIDIWRLPRILLIGLNRFIYKGQWREKISSYVDFPIRNLDLTPYLDGPKNLKSGYNLYGISNHYGTIDGGHYTAYCRNPVTKNWYKYDDDQVYEMRESDIKSSAAYVLFYTSIELTPPQFRHNF